MDIRSVFNPSKSLRKITSLKLAGECTHRADATAEMTLMGRPPAAIDLTIRQAPSQDLIGALAAMAKRFLS
jgi:hypothetical protein